MPTNNFYNRVRFQATTSGTGAFTAGSAIQGFRAPTVVPDGGPVSYTAEYIDGSGNIVAWETGHGVWHSGANNMTRDTPLEGSAATPVNFSSPPIVWLDALAQDIGQRQRSATASPIVISDTDDIICCDVTGAVSCALPAAATRAGRPLLFKDAAGKFGAGNLTITPNGTEKIDGLSSVVLGTNYQFIRLRPFSDGVHSGWLIES